MSERFKETMQSLEASWSFEDLVIANELLDAFDDAEARARAEAERT